MIYKSIDDGFVEECDFIAFVKEYETEDGKTDYCILRDFESIEELNKYFTEYKKKAPLVIYEPWRKAIAAWAEANCKYTVKKEPYIPNPHRPESEQEYNYKLTIVFDEDETWSTSISFDYDPDLSRCQDVETRHKALQMEKTFNALEEGKVYDMGELVGFDWYKEEHEKEEK